MKTPPKDFPKLTCSECAALEIRDTPTRWCLRNPPVPICIPKVRKRVIKGELRSDIHWQTESYYPTVSPETPACMEFIPLSEKAVQ